MIDKLDWSEPLIRARKTLDAAEKELALNHHVQGRMELWICRRALNEAENASLDISPAP